MLRFHDCFSVTAVFLLVIGLLGVESLAASVDSVTTNRWSRVWHSPQLISGFDFRDRWEELGVRWNAYYLYYFGSLLSGGRDAPTHRGSMSLDVIGRVDFERLAGWRGLSFLTHLKSTYGENINPKTGALSQPIDDADYTEWFWVDQVWLQQSLLNRRVQLQLGYLDQQTVLDRNAYANSEDKQFMAQFLDNNNAIIPLQVGLGATLYLLPTDSLDFSIGFADADNRTRHVGFDTFFDGADSLIGFFQTGIKVQVGQLPGHYRFGAYPKPAVHRQPGRVRCNR